MRTIITVLCGVGLYASLFMLRKGIRAERGELTERSVVQTPRARLFGGVPNALIGTAYYPALAIAVWFATERTEMIVIFAAALFAAAVSAVLAYSLLYVTKMPCVYCWTSHLVNWTLAVCTALLLA
ncbi:MAG TPA: vitamin K epoxide reductase family protein [Candidatus Baltobacteraceae bacterium]|nr:vitamin K epoxide reductase family protein [Candidatus Baltobacteraceae bacterium]